MVCLFSLKSEMGFVGDGFRRSIQEKRKEKGLTQVQLAEKVGVTENAIQNYEAGKRTPNVYTAQKITDALEEDDLKKVFPN